MQTSIGTTAPEELLQEVNKREQELQKPFPWELNGKYLLDLKIEEIPTLIDPIMMKRGLVALAGPSDGGKSTLLRQLAIAIVNRRKEFLGFPLNIEHGSAIYVHTEDPDEETQSYFLNTMNEGIDISKNIENLRVIIDTENLIEKLDQSLNRKRADVVIIDCFADLYGGAMNETNKIRTYLDQYSPLVRKYGCLVIFLHHEGKNKEAFEPSKHNLLGSQGFEAKMRLVMLLRRDPHYIHKRHLCIVKGNHLADEHKTESYVIQWDEHRIYTMTDERVPFYELSTDDRTEKKEEMIKKVREMAGQDMKQVNIAKELGISQGTVSNYLKDY